VTKNASNQISSVYDKPRAPPKIRRPVPINERDRYDYTSASKTGQQPAPAPVPTTTATTTTTTTTTEVPSPKPKGQREQPAALQPATEEPIEYYDDDDDEEEVPEDEYETDPKVPAVKPAVVAVPAPASKPESSKPEPLKPARAAARTSVVTDYDDTEDSGSRRPAVVRPKAANKASPAAAPAPQPAARTRPAAERVQADDYEDELPVAATKQSIAAATKQRTSGPFLSRPSKPARVRAPPSAVADEYEEPMYQQQQQQQQQQQSRLQSQRVSVRHVMQAAPHRPLAQQSAAEHYPRAQYSGHKQVRSASAANRRRPVRPVYEYADEYYDE